VTADQVTARWANAVIEDVGVDLLRYLVRRAPQEDVPDLLNDTLSVVWERRGALPETPTEARMWAFGVARNTLRKHRHNHSKRTRLAEALRSVIRSGGHASSHALDPADAMESHERHADVRAALGTLHESDRELITLIHWDDFTLAQAAALTGMNPSTARTRYARAKKRLAAHLEQHRPHAPTPSPVDSRRRAGLNPGAIDPA
jgi:RNA polymerase sigma-70 factor (ECF subfamily)